MKNDFRAWKCVASLCDENGDYLFMKGKYYTEQDDRGEEDESGISICLWCELGRKFYLAGHTIRMAFEEIPSLEYLKESAHLLSRKLIIGSPDLMSLPDVMDGYYSSSFWPDIDEFRNMCNVIDYYENG